jgi:hypothetical protein
VRALAVEAGVGWGFGSKRKEWFGCAARGLVYGLATMGLLVIVEYVMGILVWDERRVMSDLVAALLGGLLAGIFIGFIEETFFRGILFTAFRRQSLRAAVLVPALLYSGCHFISSRGNYSEITWTSGFDVLAGAFWQFNLANLGPFLALFAVGVFLAMLREYSGHIGWAVGIHAGWVAIIRLGRECTSSNPEASLAWLAAGYDSITGYLAFAYLTAMILALALHQKRRARNSFDALAEDVAEVG